jgi:hypothetical protein
MFFSCKVGRADEMQLVMPDREKRVSGRPRLLVKAIFTLISGRKLATA